MVKRRHPIKSNKKPSTGVVRIISGLWRGRKLPVQDVEGLRPTTDRVRETLFNWLAGDIAQANCLDLFSGAGALGFEAASRHAQQVTMIELNTLVFKQLQQNCTTLNAENITLKQCDALTFLSQPSTPMNVVFIDPPFRQGLLEETCEKLEENGWLSENAMIYLEAEKEWPLNSIPQNWELHREKTAGQVCYRLFIRK
ncbi:16S rRNA (guanine(966)-N(2))-methyltransferase RsmD [Vibrio sp. WJH972]